MTRIIGIDPSIRATGICSEWNHAYSIVQSGRKSDARGDFRLTIIRNSIQHELDQEVPRLAVLESLPPYAKGSASLGLVHGVIREVLASRFIPAIQISPSSLKKFATNNGKAGKDRMKTFLQVSGLLARADDWDDNAVDAWWLRQVGCAYLGLPHWGVPLDEYDVLQYVKKL